MIDREPESSPPPPQESLQRPGAEPKSIEAKSWPNLVAKYLLFKEKLNPKTGVIYHPCGANDVSPSSAFPESRVIYVDINEKCIKALQDDGFDAHAASALKFNPGEVDILIMLNPTIPPDIPSSYVVEKGFVLSNNYHGTASSLYQNDQYRLCAVIGKSRDGGLTLDDENLENCWKEIDTDEEFKSAPFDWGAANYKMATQIVETVTGKRENILAEYKKIINMARERQRQENALLVQAHPEFAESMSDPDKENVLTFNYGERQFTLATTLPRKKGTVDDIFVFQKVKPNPPLSRFSSK